MGDTSSGFSSAKFLRGLLFGPFSLLGLAFGFLIWWGLQGFSSPPGAALGAMLQGAADGQVSNLTGLAICGTTGIPGGLCLCRLTARLAGWDAS
jgi:hypothetical protein